MELFRPRQFNGEVLYCDLDTVILKDITSLTALESPAELIMMRDYKYPHLYNSCLMRWKRDMSFFYKLFMSDKDKYMELYKNLPYIGDQGFIQQQSKYFTYPSIAFWQDLVPQEFFINYPCEFIPRTKDWEKASLAWWTWKPKPHQLREVEMIKENWI
jgi:hypothetical protein